MPATAIDDTATAATTDPCLSGLPGELSSLIDNELGKRFGVTFDAATEVTGEFFASEQMQRIRKALAIAYSYWHPGTMTKAGYRLTSHAVEDLGDDVAAWVLGYWGMRAA